MIAIAQAVVLIAAMMGGAVILANGVLLNGLVAVPSSFFKLPLS